MICLLTGGTGFIGRRLARRLVAEYGPAAVVCLVKPPATPQEQETLAWLRSSNVRIIDGDLLNDPASGEPPPTVDVVFHLAANIDTDASEDALRVNHEGTRRLLDWLSPVLRGTRLMYASSVAVHDRISEPDGPICETSPLTPRTAYGRTKLLGEEVLRERAAQHGYSWTVLRLPTVYGPGQKADGLFDRLAKMARDGSLPARIDWPGRTSIIHVDDVARVMIDLAQRAEAAGEIYCVASDESLTVGELARGIGRAAGHPIRPVTIPLPMRRLAGTVVWNRTIERVLPRFTRLPFWRLSLMLSDGFWFDTTKFRRIYTRPLMTLDDGLADVRHDEEERARQ